MIIHYKKPPLKIKIQKISLVMIIKKPLTIKMDKGMIINKYHPLSSVGYVIYNSRQGLLTRDQRFLTPYQQSPVADVKKLPSHSGGTVQESHLFPY